MATQAAILVASNASGSVKTASTTPAYDTTFSPDGQVIPGVYRWVDRSGGIPVGYPTMTLSVRRPTKGSRVYKIVRKLSIPTLADVSYASSGLTPPQQVDHSCQKTEEWILPEASTEAERLALLYLDRCFASSNIVTSDGSANQDTGSPLLAAIQYLEPVSG